MSSRTFWKIFVQYRAIKLAIVRIFQMLKVNRIYVVVKWLQWIGLLQFQVRKRSLVILNSQKLFVSLINSYFSGNLIHKKIPKNTVQLHLQVQVQRNFTTTNALLLEPLDPRKYHVRYTLLNYTIFITQLLQFIHVIAFFDIYLSISVF